MDCPICGGMENFYTKKKDDNLYSYFICKTCESIFLDSNVLARIADEYKRGKENADVFSILEVGANEHKNLKLFL